MRLLGSKFFGELQGQRSQQRSKTYDINYNYVEPQETEEAPTFVATGTGSSCGDDWDAELEQEFIDTTAAQEDSDTPFSSPILRVSSRTCFRKCLISRTP